MDIRQLRSFLMIVDERSLNGAARRLGVRQPSLSQQLARLEDEIGEALFDRLGRGVALTRAGELLVPHAREIVAKVEGATRAVKEDLERGRGVLAVGAIPTIAPFVIPEAVNRIRERFPETEITFVEATTPDLIEMVVRADIELGVIASKLDDDDRVRTEHLSEEQLLLAVSTESPFAQQEDISRSDLESAGVIILDEVHCLGETRSFGRHLDIERLIRIEAGQLSTALGFVRQQLGITVIPEMCAASHPLDGITVRPVRDGYPARPIGVVSHACRARSRLAQAFVDVTRAVCEEKRLQTV